MPKRIYKVDRNQEEIVDDLRGLGFSVHITADVGRDFPDIVVGRTFISGTKDTILVEIKYKGNKPSDGQLRFQQDWQGTSLIVYNTGELLTQYMLDLRSQERYNEANEIFMCLRAYYENQKDK